MTKEIVFREDMVVALWDHMGGDKRIVETARVSTGAVDNPERDRGLINMLTRDRHGSPFEHVVATFYIECPIFVVRQFQRHRIASFSEESGRYSEIRPEFYVPSPDRKLRQSGKPAAYTYHTGSEKDHRLVEESLRTYSSEAYHLYSQMIGQGIAREVARMVLPLNTYTRFFVTMNSRSIMNFLSLRQLNPDATFDSNPQAEINVVAQTMHEHLKTIMPIGVETFEKNGYVSP